MTDLYYEILVPGCTKCKRGPDVATIIRFQQEARPMLEAAGFLDWAVWEDKPTHEVADHFEMLWKKMNRDADKYVELAKKDGKDGDSWWLYGFTMEALKKMAKACRENPQGLVKVRAARR